MGTDIWVHLLRRTEENTYKELKLYAKREDCKYGYSNKEEFIEIHPPYEGRDYILFGKLAGVRSMEEPMTPVRGLFYGLPEDLKQRYEDGYYHSATWFDMSELPLLAKVYGETTDYEGNRYNPVKFWVEKIETILECFWIWDYDQPGNVIVQIWFDS